MRHPKFIKWEKNLKRIIDNLDDILEDKYGDRFQLHPARSPRGKTSSKAQDGLFDIVANYSLGIGSKHGKGYIVDIHMSTLKHIPFEIRQEIDEIILITLREKLPECFPGKNLNVAKEANVIKIYGDLNLGTV